MTGDTSIPALTLRSQKRLDAGATEGAGTLVCIKCDGPKAPSRINSDKCSKCNKPGYDPGETARNPASRKYVGAVAVGFPDAMMDALKAEAAKRDMTLHEYIEHGMRRVLKKDAGWVAPNLTD